MLTWRDEAIWRDARRCYCFIRDGVGVLLRGIAPGAQAVPDAEAVGEPIALKGAELLSARN